MAFYYKIIYLILLQLLKICSSTTVPLQSSDFIRINKCCEKFEILSDRICINANDTNSEVWKPKLNDENNQKYKFVIGNPACGSMQSWPIYQYEGSPDKLELLVDGTLRHYTKRIRNKIEEEENKKGYEENDIDDDKKEPFHHDYVQGHYCLEKAISNTGPHKEFLYAKICYPAKKFDWTDSDFLLRKILKPISHIISIILFLIIAIIYFVMPTLRDLVGNILTTIAVCLMFTQAASLVRDFTQFSNHVSFIIADSVLYISHLGAFFWLSSFGYYIWKKFRSRNVFLRVTDGKKYCWYSGYAWGLTLIMASLAIFAHYFLDQPTAYDRRTFQDDEQETIGWLGIAIFFSPIAFAILVDLFFILTTLKLINRRNVYGRIQHKLKSNFIMYTLICIIMSVTWLCLILSWLNFEALIYFYIFVNALQGPLMLYVCILRQKHVLFLLKKSCCYNEPPSTNDWGDEMHYINSEDY